MAQEYWAIPTGGSGPPPTEWTKITVDKNVPEGTIYGINTTGGTGYTSSTLSLGSVTKTIKDIYMPGIVDSIYGKPASSGLFYDYMMKKKERKMTPIEEARAEREKARINALMDEYEAFDMGAFDTGSVIQFDWTPEDSDKTYQYAAIYADNRRWYVTGAMSAQGLKTSAFEDWLIEKNITPDVISIMSYE